MNRLRRWLAAPITTGARRATLSLLILLLLLAGANLEFTAAAVNGVRTAEQRAASASASVMQLCRLGNAFRIEQAKLWDKVVAISAPPPDETSQQRVQRLRETQELLAYVHRVFAPRDCRSRLR